jgi:hypothetical protein
MSSRDWAAADDRGPDTGQYPVQISIELFGKIARIMGTYFGVQDLESRLSLGLPRAHEVATLEDLTLRHSVSEG